MANMTRTFGIFLSVLVSVSLLRIVIGFCVQITSSVHTKPNKRLCILDEQLYGVIGIMSAATNLQLRDIQRKIFSEFKVSNVFIRFLLDSPTIETMKESKNYSDIVFLNTSYSGRAVRFGEKLSKWFNISTILFPDAQFVGKMDDDIYICDKSFKIIWENLSSGMYLGIARKVQTEDKTTLKRIMDAMFVVLGTDLVKRIAKRRYCYDLNVCDKTRDLYDTNHGGTSLGIWLSIYDDVKPFEINKLVLHKKSLTFEKALCNTYFLLHCITSPDRLEYIQQGQITLSRDQHVASTLGKIWNTFEGKKTRTFYGTRIMNNIELFHWRDNVTCSLWGVLTTIKNFYTAIKKVSKKMCVVIVADNNTPRNTYTEITSGNFVKFLSVDDQHDLLARGLEIMAHVPWNHFGRKNVGYVYAIMHGAKSIFDFDDDNFIIQSLPSYKEWYIAPAVRVFNPYPSFIHLEDIPWPRGYPLSEIHNSSTWAPLHDMQKKHFNTSNIGIIQSLANHDPDVDAIWRLTRKLHMTFRDNIPIILLPKTIAPYNAQATLHFALWGLLLPASVHSRVGDIWRSYITQRLLWDVGQSVGFVSPFVKHLRDGHNFKTDFNREIPLYVKSEALINVLNTWSGTSDLLEGRIVELYIELFEREFVEYSDVLLIQKWVRTLKQIEYKFPPLSS